MPERNVLFGTGAGGPFGPQVSSCCSAGVVAFAAVADMGGQR